MGLFDKLKNVLFEETEVEEDVEETKEVRREIPNYSNEKKNKRVVDIDEDDATMSLPKINKESKHDKLAFEDLEEQEYDFEKEVDHDLFKIDKTFDFPAFDEDEFEEFTPRRKEEPKKVEPVVEEKRVKPKKEVVESPKRDYGSPRISSRFDEISEKKTFKPSPVMSPVYGILDKNYRKEDVLTRDEKLASQNVKLDVDSVRKKAFGTLEEDLGVKEEPKIDYYDEEIEETVIETPDVEETLLDEVVDNEIDVTKEMEIPEEKEEIKDNIEEEIEKEYAEDESLDEIDKLFEEPTLELPKTKSRTKKKKEDLDEIDEIVEEVKEETKEDLDDDVKVEEDDLFELIDSMYENKEEE